MDYKIEERSLDNLEDYIRVNALAWKETYQGIIDKDFLDLINREEEIKKAVDRQKDHLADEEQKKYILKVNGKSVGMLALGASQDKNYPQMGEIKALYLLERVKHQGYGKVLFEKGIADFKKMGFHSMIISCLQANQNANHFYLHQGGKLVGTRAFSLPDQEELIENVYSFEI